MDLRLVQYFVAVAEELHFGRAAERLHIAQPSLSHQIRRLEQQLGVTLLDRGSRRVELTDAGRALLSEGRRLLVQSERTTRLVRSASAERLIVGFYGSAATLLLPELLRQFAEEHPSAEVSVRELLLDEIDELLAGGVDVAFTRLLPGQAEVELEIIAREPRVAALPAGHPLAGRSAVQFDDLREESFITNPVIEASAPPRRWLTEQARHGLPGRVAGEAASVQEILTLVAAGQGICLVPAAVANRYPRDDVVYAEVSDAEPAVVSLAWPHGGLRPIVAAFIDITRRSARGAG
ncbi:MAG: LysR family transcriptional regulator [Solirubrobacterales bacterium]|nr:LysR family transcriptional regulator [Solirubrobacterales bacterium]